MPSNHFDPRNSLQNQPFKYQDYYLADDTNREENMIRDIDRVVIDDMNNNAPDLTLSSVSETTDGSLCSSEPGSEVPSEAGEVLFSPRLSVQRHQAVLDILKQESVTSVADLGCNSLRFLSLVKTLTGLQYLAGVDIDSDLMEEYKHWATPSVCKWLEERPNDFLIELWRGDVTDTEGAHIMEDKVEAVTSIELIEHLDPDKVDLFTETVLGVIKPRIWIVTTPNRDYNELFPDWPGPDTKRHWDHKFEWSREEFRDWARSVTAKYPDYNNSQYSGVGFTDGCEQSHGPASQIVIFRHSGSWSPPRDLSLDPVREAKSDWKLLHSFLMPSRKDNRTKEEKIMGEVMFYAEFMARNKRTEMMESEPYEVPDSVLVKYEEILQFEPVKKLVTNVEDMFEAILIIHKDDDDFENQWQWDFNEQGIIVTSFDCPSDGEDYNIDEELISDN